MTPRTSAQIITLPVIYITQDDLGGWLVVTWRGHSWLFGSRTEAISEALWLKENERGRRL